MQGRINAEALVLELVNDFFFLNYVPRSLMFHCVLNYIIKYFTSLLKDENFLYLSRNPSSPGIAH
jgi:hypothetical protein